MIPRFIQTALIALSLALLAVLALREATASAPSIEQPLIVRRDQGEVRLWRPLPGGVRSLRSFTIKIDRQNGGSPDFWFISSEIPSGAAIRYHRHLYQDEVLFIDSGVARIHVGNLQGDAHAGTILAAPRLIAPGGRRTFLRLSSYPGPQRNGHRGGLLKPGHPRAPANRSVVARIVAR